MTRNGARAAGIAAVAAAAGLACTVEASWSWRGDEASASLTWTIDDNDPTTAICAGVGGAFVVLWVSEDNPGCDAGSEDCGTGDAGWIWDCTAGTADTGAVFRAGPLWMAWALTGSGGEIREATRWQQQTLRTGNNHFTIDWTPPHIGAPDAAAVGNWTIDGEAATADTCAAAGADQVQATWRITGATPETTMQWPCADATGTTGNIFRTGTRYDVRWDLLDADSNVLASSPDDGWTTRRMEAGDNTFDVDFAVAVAPDARIVGSWTIEGAAADAARCTAAGAATVRLTWNETGSADASTGEWPCADATGSTDLLLLSGTSYDLAWDLLDEDDEPLASPPAVTETLAAGDNEFDVAFSVGGHLEVTLTFGDKLVGPSYGDCAWPPDDVAEIGYSLVDARTEEVFDEVDIDTAAIPCTATLAWDHVPFGTYDLAVDGRAAAPDTATWHGECSDIAVDDLTGNTASCQVEMTAE